MLTKAFLETVICASRGKLFLVIEKGLKYGVEIYILAGKTDWFGQIPQKYTRLLLRGIFDQESSDSILKFLSRKTVLQRCYFIMSRKLESGHQTMTSNALITDAFRKPFL